MEKNLYLIYKANEFYLFGKIWTTFILIRIFFAGSKWQLVFDNLYIDCIVVPIVVVSISPVNLIIL